mmetsp:Transcript_22557/g.35074  ORF Transcript_22557/g.35074 Transcript_22557/m.35074 type:complete len:148 (+) Transcript_22557:113-556(+)
MIGVVLLAAVFASHAGKRRGAAPRVYDYALALRGRTDPNIGVVSTHALEQGSGRVRVVVAVPARLRRTPSAAGGVEPARRRPVRKSTVNGIIVVAEGCVVGEICFVPGAGHDDTSLPEEESATCAMAATEGDNTFRRNGQMFVQFEE